MPCFGTGQPMIADSVCRNGPQRGFPAPRIDGLNRGRGGTRNEGGGIRLCRRAGNGRDPGQEKSMLSAFVVNCRRRRPMPPRVLRQGGLEGNTLPLASVRVCLPPSLSGCGVDALAASLRGK